MKKLLILISILFLLCGCQKMETKLQGKFFADTIDGIIYIELLSDNNCIAYFSGGKEDAGYWLVLDGNEISVIASPELQESSYASVRYRISGHGTIKDANSFSVPATRYRYYRYSSDKEEKTLYFKRR